MQAVPSGSGRFGVEKLQDMQSSGASQVSGKALVTAALAKGGLMLRRSAKVSCPLSGRKLEPSGLYPELHEMCLW